MLKTISLKLLSALLNLTTCLAVAGIILWRQDWFGSGDLYAFMIWTAPLALLLAIIGKPVLNIFQADHLARRILFIIALSIAVAIAWYYGIYFFVLGPWIHAFSFPVLYIWIVGTLVQLLFLDRYVAPVIRVILQR